MAICAGLTRIGMRQPRPHNFLRRRLRRRRGSTLLETAIILPILITIVLACVDLGRFVHTYIAVTNAARAGAGFASFNPFTDVVQATWEAQVRQAVVDEIDQLFNFDASQLSVTASRTIEPNNLWRARVEVHYPFQTLVPWPFLPGYDPPLDLTRTVEMRGIR